MLGAIPPKSTALVYSSVQFLRVKPLRSTCLCEINLLFGVSALLIQLAAAQLLLFQAEFH